MILFDPETKYSELFHFRVIFPKPFLIKQNWIKGKAEGETNKSKLKAGKMNENTERFFLSCHALKWKTSNKALTPLTGFPAWDLPKSESFDLSQCCFNQALGNWYYLFRFICFFLICFPISKMHHCIESGHGYKDYPTMSVLIINPSAPCLLHFTLRITTQVLVIDQHLQHFPSGVKNN